MLKFLFFAAFLIAPTLLQGPNRGTDPGGTRLLGGFNFGQTVSTITEAECTIQPGVAPPQQAGVLAIACGMLTPGKTDFLLGRMIQPPSASASSTAKLCKAAQGEWCLTTTVEPLRGKNQNGALAKMGSGDKAIIKFKLGADNQTWTISALLNGIEVSTLKSLSGNGMRVFGAVKSCGGKCDTPIESILYSNMTIVLAAADPNVGKKSAPANNNLVIVPAIPVTTDRGKSWSLKQLIFPK